MPVPVSASIPNRVDLESDFAQIDKVLHSSLRPLSTKTGHNPCMNEETAKSNLIAQLKHLNLRNVQTIKDLLLGGRGGKSVDDQTYIMERVIQLAAELPLDSKSGVGLTHGFLRQLWSDLDHPPMFYVGSEFKYRSADGSNNNHFHPRLGAAGGPYARTVRPEIMQPIALPDPGVVFDSVLERRTFQPHPNNISSVLFYLATIITHDLFKTSHKDPNCTNTSSYLDLSPLYGNNQEDQALMRTFKEGMIKPDAFSDRRIHGFPPGVGVLLLMFNRFHNYTVEQLALINENGRFSKPTKSSSTDQCAKYDNDLFQTGRLITCGLYINIVLKDYVRTILNLNRTKSLWTLDPRSKMGDSHGNDGATQFIGNQVSAEFNLVYRWHSAISQRDEKWTQGIFHKMFPGKSPGEITEDDFIKGMGDWERVLPHDPIDRPLAGLKRTSEGKFKDDELAAIFASSVEDCAGAFGANHTPLVLRAVEILGIKRARSWNLSTLNEFRKHFKLVPHKTFEDINPDPRVAEQLKRLYDSPDLVELYPGIVVEKVKEPVKPGSGLCTNFTISRAILSDAVALVKGDRFYTIDYTPKHLTNWGFSLVDYSLNVDYGCVFYKLVLRALPFNFPLDSVYAHYPLVVPSENHAILTEQGLAGDYSFEKPQPITHPVTVSSYAACKAILEDRIDSKTTWGEANQFLMNDESRGQPYGADFVLSGDDLGHFNFQSLMAPVFYGANWESEVKKFYEHITLKLLSRSAYSIGGHNQVDIVRDVSNLVQVHFASTIFSLPLQTEENPHGIFSETELYLLMAIVFTSIFYNSDPASSFPLRQAARNIAQKLGKAMEGKENCDERSSPLQSLLDLLYRNDSLSTFGVNMIRSLLSSPKPTEELVWTRILPTAGAMVVHQSQLFSQCLDYYLSEEGRVHLGEINRLSKENTATADGILLHYFMEGSRLRSTTGLPWEASKSIEVQDGKVVVQVEAGQQVLCNLAEASVDPAIFPHPHQVVLDRDLDLYIHHGIGSHRWLGHDMTQVAMTAMLKTVGQLDNLRRAPGPQGQIKKVAVARGYTRYMSMDQSSYVPFPTSMKIQWDGGELPAKKTDG